MPVIDGSISEWPDGSRLDTPQTGAPGYGLYGTSDDDRFYFAITSANGRVGAGTTIWIDSDLDRSSGYQIWGFAGGAEYSIEVEADGVVRLYSEWPSRSLLATLESASSPDGQVMEIGLPRSLLAGDPNQLRVYADVNNAAYLPNDYSNVNFVVGEEPAVSYGGVVLDGSLSDWSSSSRLDTPENGAAGYALYGDVQENAFVFAISSDSARIGAGTTIWLDTDLNKTTGHQIWGSVGGSEYNINIGADGVARLYTGGAGETLVGEIDYRYSADGLVLELAVPKSMLAGNPDQVRVLADINDSVFIPNDYANSNIIVGSSSAPPQISYGTLTLDGNLSDWGAGTRLDTPASGVDGYAFYGDRQGDAFVFALSSDSVRIGANTTIWLDTDLNKATGYQIWGLVGGAEYNINIGDDGVARLFTGGASETFVAEIDYSSSADGRILELAVQRSLLAGNPDQVRVLADINNNVFIPNDYAASNIIVGDAPPLPPPPVNPNLRIAIVYSETTAAHFFDLTNYGHLFMSAQNQARQAGIPFDLLTEADLRDPANLSGYDAIVFPAFSHVRAADLSAISSALDTASKSYGVGLIATGNFMTNDETGAAFGDAYARMYSLLGVSSVGFGNTNGFDLVANGGPNPVLDTYQQGETVGTYPGITYQYYGDATGNGQVLFDQVVSDGSGGQASYDAVIATTTGGRNVHFATTAISGNTNILGQAIDWVVHGDEPDVSLSMSRGTGLFYARNDMDHGQAYRDQHVAEPGIYDLLLPIVESWHEKYGFVGSFYIDIGANPPSTWTDWSLSSGYYERLLELGSDIGSHSYTHPFDTNVLEPDTPELLRIIEKVDPRNPDSVDPWTLPRSEQDLLYRSYRFQFETSKLIIEKYLGIDVAGAAVPGQPEKLAAALQMIQYYDYLTGGFSGIGTGYPGAIGYLTPDNMAAPYIAPNMTFEFTLLEYQSMTPAQVEAYWAKEYAALTSQATTPIIAFPWHDYGPTNWNYGEPEPKNYNVQMFESVIARAAADGMEFVTGRDLAARLNAFQASNLVLERDGGAIVATVGTGGAGTFALTLGDGQTIASVENWYAWNDNQVFLPRDGGTFRIATDGTLADVTRLSSLPMRAELVSVNGDGSDLDFAIFGQGTAGVTLRSQGSDVVHVTGMDAGGLTGNVVQLTFQGQGSHAAGIDYLASGGTVRGSDQADIVLGGTASDRIDAGGGNDLLRGGAGPDEFVFRANAGTNTVLDFMTGVDHLVFVDSSYGSAEQVSQAFVQTSLGLELDMVDGGRLILTGLQRADLQASDILFENTVSG